MITLSKSNSLLVFISGAIGMSTAALVLYLVIIGGNQEAIPFLTFKDTDFNFHVYCPIDTPNAYKYFQSYYGYAYDNTNSSSFYVVYMQARNVTTTTRDPVTGQTINQTDLGLYYCGLAREWLGTCQNAQLICSAPGPMFYLPVDQEVTIAWIHNISSQGIAWPDEGCYSPGSSDMECSIDAKIIDYTRPQTEGCTYNLPTNFSFPSRKVRVNKTQIPVSPHIHGLETRPAFDGNPLSWFNNVGDKGVGYFSLNDSAYFYQFDNPESILSFLTDKQKLNMKIIRANNKQPAGSLFYHDHGMKSTKFNVAHGLAGMYILYNKTAEASLPRGAEQKYILFSHANDGDARGQMKMNQLYNDKIFTINNGTEKYNRNMTYRFRILNAHYDNVYYNISFAAYYKTVQLPNGTKVIQEIDPYTTSFPLTDYLTKVNFTIIGTDATLFHKPVSNINSFDAGSAERVDALIKFGPENGIPLNVNNFYLICYDASVSNYVIKHKFTLDQVKSQNKYPDPVKTTALNVPFYDLSTIPQSKIAVNRMRALFSRPSDQRFLINGHYMFTMGRTENPKIGTTEDWYIINNLFEPHPMHFHLVNFQVMQTFDLKKTPQGCTLYELDYFRFSNYPSFKGLNNVELCYALGNLTLEQTTHLYHFLDSYSPEDEIKPSSIGPTSGLNVLEPIRTPKDREAYAIYPSCPLNSVYKYACMNTTGNINGWYKRWKETALVRQYTVMVLRVRWASTNYDENVAPYPYFSRSEDEMMEFPGFVYHCHILPHEDNEMMRPIMLKPSDKYLQNRPKFVQTTSTSNLVTQYPNPFANATTWYDWATVINSFLHCPA